MSTFALAARPAAPFPETNGSDADAIHCAHRGASVSILVDGRRPATSVPSPTTEAQRASLRLAATLAAQGRSAADLTRLRVYTSEPRGTATTLALRNALGPQAPEAQVVQVPGLAHDARVVIHALAGPPGDHRLTLSGLGGAYGADTGAQAQAAIAALAERLAERGLDLSHVRRTHWHVLDIGELDALAAAHQPAFAAHPPATTVLQVDALRRPDARVELDAEIATGHIERLVSESPWEPWFGFARATRGDDRVCISGATGAGDDVRTQAVAILDSLQDFLHRAGARWCDVLHLNLIHRDGVSLALVRELLAERIDGSLPTLLPLRVQRLASDTMWLELDAEADLRRP